MKNISIVLASGTGERFGSELPKQFLEINGKSILAYSLEAFEINKHIDEIILVTNYKFRNIAETIAKKYNKVTKILNGGKTRVESSNIGTRETEDDDNVLIHDAVRPFITQKIINDNIEALKKYTAVGTAINSIDTIIQIDENLIIQAIPNRNSLKRVQTPQSFKSELIKKAHALALMDSSTCFTDDCGLILKYNLAPIYVVDGDEKNIKITTPSDILLFNNQCND